MDCVFFLSLIYCGYPVFEELSPQVDLKSMPMRKVASSLKSFFFSLKFGKKVYLQICTRVMQGFNVESRSHPLLHA